MSINYTPFVGETVGLFEKAANFLQANVLPYTGFKSSKSTNNNGYSSESSGDETLPSYGFHANDRRQYDKSSGLIYRPPDRKSVV